MSAKPKWYGDGIFSKVRARDGKEVFYAQYWHEGKRITEKGGTTLLQAQKLRLRRLDEKDNRLFVHPAAKREEKREAREKRLTFGQLVERFLKEYRTRSGKMDYYAWRAEAWKDHFGDAPAAEIKPADVEAFRRVREKAKGRRKGERVTAATIRKDLVSLSTLFRWAKAQGIMERNPADPDLVKRPAELRSQTTYLTDDQEKKLLDASPAWLQPIIRWAIGTGMDREEIVRLNWLQVDESAGVVHAPRGKTGVAREIPLNQTLRAILANCRKVRTIAGGPHVFLGAEGQPLTVEAVKTAIRRAYVAANVEVRGPFKVFRHSFASRLAMKGHPASAIAALMGHTTQTITDRYMHLSPKYLRDVMKSLDARPPRARAKKPQGEVGKGSAQVAV